MLNQEEVEKIVFEVMGKYAKENGGANGWHKKAFIDAVLEVGGDMDDVYACMALGVETCLDNYYNKEHKMTC